MLASARVHHLRLVPSKAKGAPSPDAAPTPTSPPHPAPSSSPFAHLTDGELVALGSQGNRNALEALYRRHAAFVIHLATRLQGSANDVDDVCQDAFLKAFHHMRELKDPNSFRSWVGSIAVREMRSLMRRSRIMRMVGLGGEGDPIDLDAIVSSSASPSDRAEVAQVYALLQTQPVDRRIAWILRVVEGHEVDVVAQITGCSRAAVKRRVASVQAFLDECFVESHDGGGPAHCDRNAAGSSNARCVADLDDADSEDDPGCRCGETAR